MQGFIVRAGTAADIPFIRDIYNFYVRDTAITFELREVNLENRLAWFAQFADGGRYRLLVAEAQDEIVGYAYSGRYRAKAAYDTSIEVTIYTDPKTARKGVGKALYSALFDVLRDEDIHRAYAVITKPNGASEGFHAAFGFREAGLLSGVGYKFGRFHDTGYWEKKMDES